MLCTLLLVSLTACAGESSAQKNDTVLEEMRSGLETQNEVVSEKTLSGLNAWYSLTIGLDDYEMFQASYRDIITEDFYSELSKLYERNKRETNVCLLHTLSDGTRVLLTLEFEDSYWTQFRIKSIEILEE